MQNLANLTSAEGVVAGSALLVLWVAPTALAWNDARRRRKALAQAMARERALAEAAARERALAEAAAREALLPVPPFAADTATGLMDLQQLWDEPTVTVDADLFSPDPAAVFEVPAEPPAALEALPPLTAMTEPPPLAVMTEPPPLAAMAEARTEAVQEAQPAAAALRFEFCLQELRRVRLPNWPPAAIHDDPARSEVWHEAERLAAQHQREIGAAPLVSPQRAQSSCLGSAEADAAGMRLRFLLFPVLWPSTEEQATAEAVFEINRADGTIRSYVNSLRRSY